MEPSSAAHPLMDRTRRGSRRESSTADSIAVVSNLSPALEAGFDLEASIDACVALTQSAGKTFYYAFVTLPRPMFRDMCVLYAFMRLTDDWADEQTMPIEEREAALNRWRHDLQEALSGRPQGHLIFPALADLVARHHIPRRLLSTVIEGVRSDLAPRHCQTFEELKDYCYQVAGAVGLCCLRIWGCKDDAATPFAIDCGAAFQLTNILRDVAEDAAIGRIYLPADEMARFGYRIEDLHAGLRNEQFTALMRFQSDRAWSYYQRADDLTRYLEGPSRRVFRAMTGMYSSYLTEIERRQYDVFSRRVRLSKIRKLTVALTAFLGIGRRRRRVFRPEASHPLPTNPHIEIYNGQ